jgi:UDP-N-acetylglucosamine 4-epimerase
MLASLREHTGSDLEATHVDPRPGDVRHSLADTAKAESLLGYRPRVSVSEGLARAYSFYAEQGAARVTS